MARASKRTTEMILKISIGGVLLFLAFALVPWAELKTFLYWWPKEHKGTITIVLVLISVVGLIAAWGVGGCRLTPENGKVGGQVMLVGAILTPLCGVGVPVLVVGIVMILAGK